MNTSSRAAIDTLAWLTEDAFDGDPDHSLLANLRDLTEKDWTALPPGCGRSIADILEHVGWSKWMYEDYAFGLAAMQGDQPPLVAADGARSRPHAELLVWLTGRSSPLAGRRARPAGRYRARAGALDQLGERLPTRTIIRIMIAHDLYHAGEINHIRALLHDTDRWPYE